MLFKSSIYPAADIAEGKPLQKVIVASAADNATCSKWCIIANRVALPLKILLGNKGLNLIVKCDFVSIHMKSSDIRKKKVLETTRTESSRDFKSKSRTNDILRQAQTSSKFEEVDVMLVA